MRWPTVPLIIFHGDRDSTVNPVNGTHVLEQAIGTSRTKKNTHRGQIPGGHSYTRTTYADGEREIMEHWNIHGAALPAPIRILRGQTQQKKCCVSS